MFTPRFSGGISRPPLATTSSPMRISPEVALSSPAMQRSVDVLPQPEGPSSDTNSPSATEKETASTACTLPYFTTRSRTERSLMPIPVSRA